MKILFLFGLIVLVLQCFIVTNHVLALSTVTNEYFPQVAEEPDRYVVTWAKLSGQIENKSVFEDVTVYVFKVGGVEGTKNQAYVQYDTTSKSFSVDDCLILEENIQGSTQLENYFGTTFKVPYLNVEKYTEVDCLEGLYPTIAENNIPQTQQVGGAKITLEKVQLSKDHTRLLLTIE